MLGVLGGGVACLVAFAVIEQRVPSPMFRLPLFRIRAFTFGTLSTFLSAVARGGLMFMLIIWLQGIWLPQHGYGFTDTPLWAGIYMLPLTVGMLIAGPDLGVPVRPLRGAPVRDRRDARRGPELRAAGAAADRLLLSGCSRSMLLLIGRLDGHVRLTEPGGRDEQPAARHRGAGGGMNQTFQNSAQVLSIGIFFTLMILGLAEPCRTRCPRAAEPHGVSAAAAQSVAQAAAGLDPVRRLPRLQPDPASARLARRSPRSRAPTARR